VVSMIAKYCKQLEFLDLSWCQQITSGPIIDIVCACPNVRVIKLRRIDGITDAVVDAITQAYATQLQVLDLRRCSEITSESLLELYKLTSVEKLSLSWIQGATDEVVDRILKGCDNLKQLKLEGCKALTLRGIECLASETPPPCAVNLKLLDLSWCNSFTSQTLEKIASTFTQLTVLDYYGIKMVTLAIPN